MNVASKELCEELYKLSGWHNGTHWSIVGEPRAVTDFPKYDLGYLLRKLPDAIHNHEHDFTTRFHLKKGTKWLLSRVFKLPVVAR